MNINILLIYLLKLTLKGSVMQNSCIQFSKSYMHGSFFAIHSHLLFCLKKMTGMIPLTITYHKYLHLPL